jgi:hypothetical protein
MAAEISHPESRIGSQPDPMYLSLCRPGSSLHRKFKVCKECNPEVILASLRNLPISVFKGLCSNIILSYCCPIIHEPPLLPFASPFPVSRPGTQVAAITQKKLRSAKTEMSNQSPPSRQKERLLPKILYQSVGKTTGACRRSTKREDRRRHTGKRGAERFQQSHPPFNPATHVCPLSHPIKANIRET